MKTFGRICLVVALALAISAPALAIELELGAEVGAILDKDVELNRLDTNADYSAQGVNLLFETTLTDWLTVTPKVGVIKNSLEINEDISVDSETGISFGIEAKADVYVYEKFQLSLIGAYQYSNTEIDEINLYGLNINNPLEIDLRIHQYELGAIVSRDLSEYNIPVVPYVGLVYSDLSGEAEANLSVVSLIEDIEADNNVGVRLGLSGNVNDDITLAVDAKLIDEEAITGSVTIKF